jgi:hypothetical protein
VPGNKTGDDAQLVSHTYKMILMLQYLHAALWYKLKKSIPGIKKLKVYLSALKN